MAKRSPTSINPNTIRSRDPAMVAVINGATKAAVHVDRKKQASKRACRKPARAGENHDG